MRILGHDHIFFHSLIVEPYLAFGDTETDLSCIDNVQSFEKWMITVTEFQKILKSLYDRNYVLVRLRDLAERRVCLPYGKKPLVISFDDVDYHSYMKGFGFAERMVIDAEGEIANIYRHGDGTCSIGREFDGPPILEGFIKENPDFSFNGARGILAVTGKEGILGYHEPHKEKDSIYKLTQLLKKRGWELACHSFSHSEITFNRGRVDLERAIQDTERWNSEISPLVGGTDIYVTPFGFPVTRETDFLRYLQQLGFRYFCGVDNTRKLEILDKAVLSDRVNIDGYLFANRNYELETYYARLEDILSPERKGKYERYGNRSWDLGMHGILCSKMPTAYMFGGIGEVITEKVIQDRKKVYPEKYTNECVNRLRQCIGKNIRGFDSSGLINNYLMGGFPNFVYNHDMDLSCRSLFEKSTIKGKIDTLPEERGICLYAEEHIGIYLGNNRVAECRNTVNLDKAVMITEISETDWTDWFCCPGIEYRSR